MAMGFGFLELLGEVSMCDTPPTLIIVHVDLVQHFIEDTALQLTTGHWLDGQGM
jgi:hypothetical protein